MNIWLDVFRKTAYTIRELFRWLEQAPFREDSKVERFLDRFVLSESDYEGDRKWWSFAPGGGGTL